MVDKLENRIKRYDREIKSLCNHHNQEFVQAIQDLLEVRPKADKLKTQLIEINNDVQKSSENVQRKSEELIRQRKTVKNIETAIDYLSVCLPCLKMYSKLISQMESARYYPALKTLEQLETSYLPSVCNYRFTQTMRDNIPKIRDQIKDASISDLKDFLENIRKLSAKVGEISIKSSAHRQNIQLDESLFDDSESEEELSATDLIDFSPLYRCAHIFSCLGASEYFQDYYRKQRQQQAKLVRMPPIDRNECIDGYKNYFCGVIGFFVIENHVMNTAPGLISKSHLHEVWENALQSVIASLRAYSYDKDDKLMLNIKKIIILFTQTAQSFGYNVNPLSNLLIELRDQYNSILMENWATKFKEIFDADNYTPIQVTNSADYNEIINEFPFYESEIISIGPEEYPKKFPFSSFVPKVFTQVKLFIDACREFSQDLNLSQPEIEDMVRKSTNYLLTQTLSDSLSNLIKKPKLGLLELIQITINTNYLGDSMTHLEQYITQATFAGTSGSPSSSVDNIRELGGSHLGKLQGSSMFKNARSDAESQIYFLLNQKIDEFFEIAHYDWLLVESSGVASSYITDLIKFLTCTFQAFTNLPLRVAQSACHSTCKHMASSLMNFLLDEDVKAISMGALEQFNLDLLQCEFFASSEPVKGFEDNVLQLCFAELRQLLDLLLSWQWSTYIADYGKQESKYLRVNPQNALMILEKIKEADKNRNIFSSLKKNERDKKKLIDTVIKQLKQLIASHNNY